MIITHSRLPARPLIAFSISRPSQHLVTFVLLLSSARTHAAAPNRDIHSSMDPLPRLSSPIYTALNLYRIRSFVLTDCSIAQSVSITKKVTDVFLRSLLIRGACVAGNFSECLLYSAPRRRKSFYLDRCPISCCRGCRESFYLCDAGVCWCVCATHIISHLPSNLPSPLPS